MSSWSPCIYRVFHREDFSNDGDVGLDSVNMAFMDERNILYQMFEMQICPDLYFKDDLKCCPLPSMSEHFIFILEGCPRNYDMFCG